MLLLVYRCGAHDSLSTLFFVSKEAMLHLSPRKRSILRSYNVYIIVAAKTMYQICHFVRVFIVTENSTNKIYRITILVAKKLRGVAWGEFDTLTTQNCLQTTGIVLTLERF